MPVPSPDSRIEIVIHRTQTCMKNSLETLIQNFFPDALAEWLCDEKNLSTEECGDLDDFDGDGFSRFEILGHIETEKEWEHVLVVTARIHGELSERASRKKQYDIAKKILKHYQSFPAGIFVFYDDNGNFRFSLVVSDYEGNKRTFSHFKRYTYFVSPSHTNKTFEHQIGAGQWKTLKDVREAFAIGPVTDIFYNDFLKEYEAMVGEVRSANVGIAEENARQFVLLFSIRVVFLGFIQKRKWIGDDENFMRRFVSAYEKSATEKETLYTDWLFVLFFEALNNTFSHRNWFPPEIQSALLFAPYLNGGLFKRKSPYDTSGYLIPDASVKRFFAFLFAHNFTIEENSLEDEDLQLNPEFLGIIFERLVNKADGAVYTPRTEVDLMCRLSLSRWMAKNTKTEIPFEEMVKLFFTELGGKEKQEDGEFSEEQLREMIVMLERVTVCDPSCGSGAFLVGMMQVMDEIEGVLYEKLGEERMSTFESRKSIVSNALYGVEVKEWAVWIAQLRLWLALFIDAPDDVRTQKTPILPSLDFKIRQGDSLVQRVGATAFPVSGHNASMRSPIKRKITELKNFKIAYFENKVDVLDKTFNEPKQKELALFRAILDEELSEKEKELHGMKNTKPSQNLSMFGVAEESQQATLEFDAKKIEKTEEEIAHLKHQRKMLQSGEKPLVWNIEFADIFLDRGGFDIIIGNPPYVRHEKIADPTGRVKNPKEYKKYLEEMVRLDFPEDFPKKKKINAQSDLYVYFYIRSLKLLNPSGVHCFICSNSWLDVGYGVWLQKFLLKRAPLKMILDNHFERSFSAADVNTIISLIDAPDPFSPLQRGSESLSSFPPLQRGGGESASRRGSGLNAGNPLCPKTDISPFAGGERGEKKIKFVAFKKPFDEAIFTEHIVAIDRAETIETNDVYRVYPISRDALFDAGSESDAQSGSLVGTTAYVGDKWGGKYLRAPDIFFTILEKGKGKLVKLGDIAEVRFGIKTGVNEFFYLTQETIQKWGIEEEFLKPVIKSPRECKNILVDPKDLKYKIFLCNKPKEDLAGTNALKYIEWGERQNFHKKPTVANRKFWWQNPDFSSNVFMQMSFNDIFRFWYAEDEIRCDARLYTISLQDKVDVILLNATISILFVELFGRANLGEGALDFKVYEAGQILFLEKSKVNNAVDKIEKSILKRPMQSVFAECGIDPASETPIEEQIPNPLPDRAALDTVVFDALGLTPAQRTAVYRAVCRLVYNRISKAKSK